LLVYEVKGKIPVAMKTQASPIFARFCIPIIQTLREMGGTGNPSEVVDAVIARLNIPESEQQVVNKNGQSRVENQVQWARFYMARAGYLHSSERGVWSLTELGRKVDLKSLDTSTAIRNVRRSIVILRKKKNEPQNLEEQDDVDPQDKSDYKSELLKMLKSIPPAGFERFSQRLLREAGFQQVNVTGRSGDGGIDGNGILAINQLVSFNVLFQCKRYEGAVTPSQVRDFRGAMSGRADKGIIITTGSFTLEAKKEARRDGVVPIELVDGEKLVEMCEKLEFGLIPTKAFSLDYKLFDDFKA
jgi:restriction system protein